MKVKLKHCDGHNQLAVIWKRKDGKSYCKQCWMKQSGVLKTSIVKPTRKKIPFRSPKRAKLDKEYSIKRKAFLEQYPLCKIHIAGICTNLSTDVHHKAGRAGDLYLDERYWIATCRACHSWIDTHSAIAEELGLTIKRSV